MKKLLLVLLLVFGTASAYDAPIYTTFEEAYEHCKMFFMVGSAYGGPQTEEEYIEACNDFNAKVAAKVTAGHLGYGQYYFYISEVSLSEINT
ncbi:hypothetical protein LCGC14_2905250, partial [marine sediment metagenome]